MALVMTPEISIITVTSGRRALLAKKLESLAKQTLSPERFELVLYVNEQSNDVREVLEQAQPPFHVTVLAPPDVEAGVSAARARNKCVEAAGAQILYFSDDDCLLEPATLERHLASQNSGFRVSVGPVAFEHEARTRETPLKRVRYWNLNGANTSLPTLAFRAVGGFDETVKGYGMEDVLLGYALEREGLPFVALPEARVRHIGPDPRRSGDVSKGESAGRNAVRIASRHPDLSLRLGVHPVSLIAKRLALWPPYGAVWRGLDRPTYTYERAYLAGAIDERRRSGRG